MLRHKELSSRVIAAAIEVHQRLGPGFLESVYEAALCIELEMRGIHYERQKLVPLKYRDRPIGEHRLDLLVECVLVVELKAVKALEDIFFAITRSYMKAVEVDDGIILNFASMPLTVKRVGRENAEYEKNKKPGQSGTHELRDGATQSRQPVPDFLSSKLVRSSVHNLEETK
jgi:GxxExxY protein